MNAPKVGDRIRFGHETTSILEGTIKEVREDEGLYGVAVQVDRMDGEAADFEAIINVGSDRTGVEIDPA